MTRRISPVESFGPELLQLLLKGSLAPCSLVLPYSKAVRLRQRIYQLRMAMRREAHPKSKDAQRAHISIQWGQAAGFPPPEPAAVVNSRGLTYPADRLTPCKLTVAPQDSEFATAFASAGIKVGLDPDEDPLANL